MGFRHPLVHFFNCTRNILVKTLSLLVDICYVNFIFSDGFKQRVTVFLTASNMHEVLVSLNSHIFLKGIKIILKVFDSIFNSS